MIQISIKEMIKKEKIEKQIHSLIAITEVEEEEELEVNTEEEEIVEEVEEDP